MHNLGHQTHCSYLLRLWRGGEDGGWRASLQSIQTGERRMFANLESLLTFLIEQRCSPTSRQDRP
jgi:hypothetical protein